MGIFATKTREQEQKRPGLTEILPLIRTSAIRTSIQSFHSLQDSPATPLEVTAFTDDCDILCFVHLTIGQEAVFQTPLKYHPKEERGNIKI